MPELLLERGFVGCPAEDAGSWLSDRPLPQGDDARHPAGPGPCRDAVGREAARGPGRPAKSFEGQQQGWRYDNFRQHWPRRIYFQIAALPKDTELADAA